MPDDPTARRGGCDGRDIRADVETYPEKIGPGCGEPHVIEITRKGWDRPIRLCRVHANQANLTVDEIAHMLGVACDAVTYEPAPDEEDDDIEVRCPETAVVEVVLSDGRSHPRCNGHVPRFGRIVSHL